MATQASSDLSDRTWRPGKFVWFEHASRDARKAQTFYAEVLGWKVESWGESYDMILAGDTIDTMIGGYAEPKADGENPHWISYVSVEDVDTAAKAAAANGGRVVEAPQDLPGAGRVARITDPQGAELCLFRKDGGDPPDGPATEPASPRRFFWSELHTTDPVEALSFYTTVVGFAHRTMQSPGGAYHILSTGGVGRGGITGHLGGAPHWLPYVSLDDPDATLARARKLGAKVRMGPEDIPGIGRFGVLEDPTGAVLAIMKVLPMTRR
jgi:predicted enzyme related to lactoylglutathione lyase